MDGEPQLEALGETLDKLTANPDLAASMVFPITGITVTLHSAGDGQWDMISRSERRGVFDVSKIDEDALLFRLSACDTVEKIAADITAERAAPKFADDVEAFLASQVQK
jgi:hypothetical protein